MNNATSTTEASASPAPQYITLKSATARKLGKYADGSIGYTISCDPGRTTLFIAITHNSSSGYFSREYIPVDRIQELIAKLDQPAFASKALRAAFITGKSSNNVGFLLAILHAERALTRDTENEAKHVVVGDWTKWKAALLTLDGSQVDADSLSAQPVVELATFEKRKTISVKHAKPANSPD
ncbi:hypothetical protein ABC383_17645 [Noviherbaspirillum sp. 1P10PC]|uniref:hypothetical protein n=1 Tax=Noviherbaspirillum sp. 1P10PC TaxID=3132292 RepID=UPI0039A0D267